MLKIGKDFLDEIEDNFYPGYMYAEPNERKTMCDLLDLASSDLPILKDQQFMQNSKQYYIDIDKNLEAIEVNDVYLNFAKEKFFEPAS